MNLSPCLLMFQGVLSRSIPTSCCTGIAVLMLVDDYCVTRPMWPLATCISSVVVHTNLLSLVFFNHHSICRPHSSLPLVKTTGPSRSASTSLFPLSSQVQVRLACVAHVTHSLCVIMGTCLVRSVWGFISLAQAWDGLLCRGEPWQGTFLCMNHAQ